MKFKLIHDDGYHKTYRSGDLLVVHSIDTPMTVGEMVANFGTDKLPFTQYKHTSVSHKSRYPTWDEIKMVKEEFHGDTFVMQFLPPRNYYVNLHPYCFHLWEIL